MSQLRAGDLVFWGSSPGSIYHTAIYIGGGRIIQAPRPGKNVEVSGNLRLDHARSTSPVRDLRPSVTFARP